MSKDNKKIEIKDIVNKKIQNNTDTPIKKREKPVLEKKSYNYEISESENLFDGITDKDKREKK